MFLVYTVLLLAGWLYSLLTRDAKFSYEVVLIIITLFMRVVFLFKNKYIGFTRN